MFLTISSKKLVTKTLRNIEIFALEIPDENSSMDGIYNPFQKLAVSNLKKPDLSFRSTGQRSYSDRCAFGRPPGRPVCTTCTGVERVGPKAHRSSFDDN